MSFRLTDPKEIFEFFEGKWNVVRHCEERSDEAIHELNCDCRVEPKALLAMTISGYASFILSSSNKLLYSEELDLQNSNWYQKYQYKYQPEENKIIKYFSNGDYFYDLILGKNTVKGWHKCLEDCYESEYKFLNENEMQITYKINGPQKNYKIITNYRRISI